MSKLSVLKACVDFIYLIGILTAGGMLIFSGMIIAGNEEVTLKMNGYDITVNDWPSKGLLVLAMVSLGLFLYAIYLLRETVALFRKRIIFDGRVVVNFERIGWCIVTSTLISHVPLFVFNMIRRNNRDFEISGNMSMDSFLVSIALGILFMVISQAFSAGQRLREENELTV